LSGKPFSLLKRPGRENFASLDVLSPHVAAVPVANKPGSSKPGQPPKHGVTSLPMPVTDVQWQQMLGLVATGTRSEDAMFELGIDPVALEGWLRSDPVKLRAWREAFIVAERRGWPYETLVAICNHLAEGMTLKAACAAESRNRLSFLTIMRRDPALKTMYDEARQIAAEIEADDLRAIADETSRDILDDGKGGERGNTAAVARSKLRVDTRLRLMGSFNRDRFAEKRDPAQAASVTVNINAADRLESARQRARQAREPVIVEAQAVTISEDDEWLNS
jgi:hypothetical protein